MSYLELLLFCGLSQLMEGGLLQLPDGATQILVLQSSTTSTTGIHINPIITITVLRLDKFS